MSHSAATTSPETRRVELIDWLERDGERSIEDMAGRFGVSSMTIRRDLQELADAGRVIRTHGGAAPAQRISFEFRFLERTRQQADEKQQIARLAASLISPGESVMLDSSTTTLAIARQLPAIGNLRVVTTSLPIASELFGREGIEVVILGGSLRKDSPDLTGALTDNNLELIHTDIAFIGADAVDPQGYLYNVSPEIGRMLQRMATTADRVYAVADHTKIGRHELMRFAHLRDWFGLLTDDGADDAVIDGLRRHGVRVTQPEAAANGGR